MKRTEVLKHCINVLAVVLMGAIAFLFTAYGLLYKNVGFIVDNFSILMSLTVSASLFAVVAAVLFYISEKQSLFRLTVCIMVFMDICAVVFFALCATGFLSKINSVEALRQYIQQSGKLAAFIFIVFSFLQVVLLPVPGSIAVAAGTAMFGPFKCSVYSLIGIVLGSIAAFAVGRLVGYKAVCWIVGQDSLDKWLEKLKGKDYLILSLMFLLPMFPDDILCFIAGLSSMTWPYFIAMIVITRIISVFTTAYSFELIPFTTWWGILIWAVLLAFVVLSFWLVCKYSTQIDGFLKKRLKINNKK